MFINVSNNHTSPFSDDIKQSIDNLKHTEHVYCGSNEIYNSNFNNGNIKTFKFVIQKSPI